MNVVESLKNLLSKKDSNEKLEAPEGVCPNCWGHGEYEGKFFEASKKHGQDLGWVQEYANTNLTGMTFTKKGDDYICPTCSLMYKEVD